MKTLIAVLLVIFLGNNILVAQLGINQNGSNPHGSAMLDVKSTTDGLLIPRVTAAQRDAIGGPADGLIVYCTDCGTSGSVSLYSHGTWRTFVLCYCPSPVPGTNVVSVGQIDWNWNAVAGALGYKWNTVNDYSTALDMGTALTKSETGIICNNTYIRYVWAYNGCSSSAATSLSATTPATPPAAPSEGTHISAQTQIIWKWNAVAGASGYRWNNVNNFTTAFEMGTTTSRTESSLACGTSYSRYAWSYNECGYSTPILLTQSTETCWTCGNPITIIHLVSGGVAPVEKVVTYGTVTNIPGETSKCWITRNLGASNQATSKDDNTEASAGWYWQFNRKQGYKHDGTTVTPSWTITGIDESSNWGVTIDPCALELGTGWHVPTYNEWYNVDNANGWTTWNQPWGSALKLHAAGLLFNTGGTLGNRGAYGYYWSNTQDNFVAGLFLFFFSGDCAVYFDNKAFAFPLRCIRQ